MFVGKINKKQLLIYTNANVNLNNYYNKPKYKKKQEIK